MPASRGMEGCLMKPKNRFINDEMEWAQCAALVFDEGYR